MEEFVVYIIAAVLVLIRFFSANKTDKALKKKKAESEPRTSKSLEDLFNEMMGKNQVESQVVEKKKNILEEKFNLKPPSVYDNASAYSKLDELSEHFKTYKVRKLKKNRFAHLLSRHGSAKDAVVLSEILKRKYD